MNTYEELLKDERWKVKRTKIVKRDGSTCQHCRNSSLDEQFNCSQAIRTYNSVSSATYGILRTSPMQFISLNVERYPNLKPFENHLIVYFFKEDEKAFPIAFRKLEEAEIVEKDGFILVPKPLLANTFTPQWLYNGTLHVHHTYYQLNRSPWDYPDEALITLCWKCHTVVHEHQNVPVISESGKIIDYYKPCKRCHGAGVFPEYRHVESGICFRCRGAKYEELISSY